jgi:4-amino-4-deoxy-L-arabinose transferase-like glycosyltransferase
VLGRRARQALARGGDRLALVVLSVVYLGFGLPYCLLTPAWEPNDEPYHAMYVEHIVAHGSFPRIGLANGIESHQPPLYYLMAAGWQWLLHIPAFVPSPSPIPGAPPRLAPGPFLTYSHHYTPVQHLDAIYLHELRLLSLCLGLATVLLAYGCARLVFARTHPALAAGLTVALLPKQFVVDTALTNDSLVITLSTLALFLFLLAEKARRNSNPGRRRWLMAGLGVALGRAGPGVGWPSTAS